MSTGRHPVLVYVLTRTRLCIQISEYGMVTRTCLCTQTWLNIGDSYGTYYIHFLEDPAYSWHILNILKRMMKY